MFEDKRLSNTLIDDIYINKVTNEIQLDYSIELLELNQISKYSNIFL